MITKAIKKAFHNAQTKGWEKTYWAFDIHETIMIPNLGLWLTDRNEFVFCAPQNTVLARQRME